MNALEAGLLDRSFSGLTDTLLRKRMLDQQDQQHADQLGLQRDTLAMHMGDYADQRANRAEALKLQEQHQQRLEDYQKQIAAAKDEETKWKVFENMGKEGMLTDDALDRMSDAFNQKFAPAGVGVKMFKLPDSQGAPQVWEDKASGRRFGYKPGSKEMHDLTPNMGEVTEEEDPLAPGGVKRKFKRKLTPEELLTARMNKGDSKSLTGDPIKDARIAEIDKEIKDHAAALAQGDESSGLRSLVPFVLKNRRPAIEALQAERAQLLGAPNAPASATPPDATSGPANAGEAQQFNSVADALKVGKKSGDIILLYDPAQRRYRRFQLE